MSSSEGFLLCLKNPPLMVPCSLELVMKRRGRVCGRVGEATFTPHTWTLLLFATLGTALRVSVIKGT